MNIRRRVLVLARHFWPTTTDDTLRLYHWLQYLRGQGAEPVVLTPRWSSDWPRQVICDHVRVQRVDHPPTHALRNGRYTRQLVQQLHREGLFDAIYCDRAGLESAAILSRGADYDNPPLVVRCAVEDFTSQPTLNRLSPVAVDTFRRATLVLAQHPSEHQQLLAAGIPEGSIVRACLSNPLVYDRNQEARQRARKILCESNHDLLVKSIDRVVVCPGELSQRWGVDRLIRELAPLIENHRALRLWILGDSRERPAIYEMLRDEGLHRLVAMPGIFTDLEQVMQAADLCIFPAAGRGLNWLLPTCLVNSIPVLVHDATEARSLLGSSASHLTYAGNRPGELRSRLSAWLKDPAPLRNEALRVQRDGLPALRHLLGCNELFQHLAAKA